MDSSAKKYKDSHGSGRIIQGTIANLLNSERPKKSISIRQSIVSDAPKPSELVRPFGEDDKADLRGKGPIPTSLSNTKEADEIKMFKNEKSSE